MIQHLIGWGIQFRIIILLLVSIGYCSSMQTRTSSLLSRGFRLSRGVLLRASSANAFSNTLSIEGQFGETNFRTFFKSADSKIISPWHDIPLRSGTNFNFVCEIPKFAREKMEINTKQQHNPISQDLLSSGKVRCYHGPIYWNYGCFPQTWENPHHLHPSLNKYGDNDPLDVVEIGTKSIPVGGVKEVKVLGVLAMIDKGELDWKVISISNDDPLAAEMNDINDLKSRFPFVVSGIREWFRWYKTPDGKPLNEFGYDERALTKAETEHVIEETHQYWKDLVSGKTPNTGKLWLPNSA